MSFGLIVREKGWFIRFFELVCMCLVVVESFEECSDYCVLWFVNVEGINCVCVEDYVIIGRGVIRGRGWEVVGVCVGYDVDGW